METPIERRARLRDELDALKKKYPSADREDQDGIEERMGNLKSALVRTEKAIISEAAGNPRNREAGTPPTPTRTRRDNSPGSEDRERGLRAIDSMRDSLSSEAGDRLEDVVRRDRMGSESRYLAAVSDAAYERAYMKRLANPDGAQFEFTAEEAEAMRVVAQATSERALAVGSGAAGQFAIPASLDPSIMLTSDGRINPIRELASKTTISTDRWQGVNSQGVTATWHAEASESTDASPELAQPEIVPEMLRVFVPFSIEVGQDWSGLQTEMAKLFSDAKDDLEAQAFTLGAGHGSNQPQGLLVGGTIAVNGGTATQVENYYDLQEDLPPRYQPRATFLSSNTQQNRAFRAVAEADSSEPKFISDDRQTILGKPWRETSHMVSTAAGTTVAYADLASAYKVVDRIGASTELIPHLFGTANNYPTGQRGLFFYARVSGEVTNPNAVRKLVVS